MSWRVQIDDDLYKDKSGSSASLPQYGSDPVSPAAEDAWVLKTTTGGGGTAGKIYGVFGLGFPLIEAGGGITTYQFSYRTLEGTTKRVTIS